MCIEKSSHRYSAWWISTRVTSTETRNNYQHLQSLPLKRTCSHCPHTQETTTQISYSTGFPAFAFCTNGNKEYRMLFLCVISFAQTSPIILLSQHSAFMRSQTCLYWWQIVCTDPGPSSHSSLQHIHAFGLSPLTFHSTSPGCPRYERRISFVAVLSIPSLPGTSLLL